jgi:hypothetical protein
MFHTDFFWHARSQRLRRFVRTL